ncbi:MAG TPA: response regulator, partial [Flavobacteriales bacterium]|nr:response regulator [Flavobacteriales bacterium]
MKRILLIAVDATVRENTAEILELAGYRVLKAEDGRPGVELAKREHPDLIICDIMMPQLDGFGVLHMVGRDPRTSDIPFIFLSARTEGADIRRGMDLGADDYLTKPYEDGALLSAIEGRLARSERIRRTFEGITDVDRFMGEARGMEALSALGDNKRVKRVRKKDMLFHEGDELDLVPMIISGAVRTFRVNSDGKFFVTGLLGPGDLVCYLGLLQGGRALENAEVIEDGDVSMIRGEDLLALLHKDRDVGMRFIKMLAKDVADREHRLLQL